MDLKQIEPKKYSEEGLQVVKDYGETHIQYESVNKQFEKIQKEYELDKQLEEKGIEDRQKQYIKNNILDEMINQTINRAVEKEMIGGPQQQQLDVQSIITQQIKYYLESIDQNQDDYGNDFNFVY